MTQELYEPMWEELCQRLKTLGIAVRSIWIADQAHQGMSSVLNEDKLGNDRWSFPPLACETLVNLLGQTQHRG